MIILIILVILVSLFIFFYGKQKRRIEFIQRFTFPAAIKQKVVSQYPHLSESQLEMVFDTLKSFFIISYKAKLKPVAMPSQVLDVAWHEFILFTRNYELFCRKGLGRFLHHTPTEAMKTRATAQEGIKTAWRIACHLENINPKLPARLPQLFAIDSLLKIEDGFIYSLNCKDKKAAYLGSDYCAGHIGCTSGCSGSSGDASTSCGSSCGSNCGSSCGSGCGGD